MKEIPIIRYQNIGNYPETMMEDGLLPETFERQMKFLAEEGYNIVTLVQALNHMNRRINLPPKSLAITIDGGFEDAFTNALPVLKKYHFPATFFIPPEFIGKETTINGKPIESLTWDMVSEISGNGIEIGILAYPGKSLRIRYDEHSVMDSVETAMKIITKKFNSQVRYCAFKEGVPSASLWEFIRALGFQAVFTQCPTNRKVTIQGIGRIQIDDDDHNIFLTKISIIYLFFKDKRSWKYIRKFKIDRVAHRISETWNWIKGES